jgi:DNA uptake protein ComE-like DNA-binding protein
MNQFIKDYFTFSRKDRIAIAILLIVVVVFLFLPKLFSVRQVATKADPLIIQQLEAITTEKKSIENNTYNRNANTDNYSESNATTKGVLFTFDPNTLSEEGWLKLGIREKTVKTILNYHSKGGKFKQPEDIRKIWGLRKDEADRIIPYIKIADNGVASTSNSYNNKYTPTPAKPTIVDVNSATPQQFKLLPGLEYPLPYKIVSYREKLGGFLTVQQVKETYGMTDSIFTAILPYLQIQSTAIRKININTASDFDLGGHPYIDKAVAKAIVIYRSKHGAYKQVSDVKKILFITEQVFNKMAPYLSVE